MRPVLALPFLALAAAVAGCGGGTPKAPAQSTPLGTTARPAVSPPLTRQPAGKLVRVGALPDAIEADPSAHEFAVAVHDPGRLALVDSATGRLQRHVAVPIGDPAKRPVPAVFLVPAETGRRAVAVQPADRTPPATPAVAAALVLERTFVADDGAVAVLDDRGRPSAHLPGAIAPGGIASANVDTRVAVVDTRRNTVSLYDPRTLKRTATAPAGAGPTNVAALGDLLFVADTRGNAVLTYATRPRLRQTGRIPFPGGAPYGLATDPVHRRLLVTLTARNLLATADLTRAPATVTTQPSVRQPAAVAIDSANGTIAVAGHSGGTLQLITAERPGAVPRHPARSAG